MNTPQRTLLITGASRGIGRATAMLALNNGWRVVGIARRFDQPLRQTPGLHAVEGDLSRLDQLDTLLKGVSKTFPEIEAVLSNAGQGRFAKLEQFGASEIRDQIDLNLTSHILLARHFLPLLKRRRQGSLIFMGSEAALRGGQKGALYCAAKFGLRGLAQSLREEAAGNGVRVGLINPGMVKTDFFEDLDFRPGDAPHQHLLPEDIARAVMLMLDARPGATIDEINLSPQSRVIDFSSRG